MRGVEVPIEPFIGLSVAAVCCQKGYESLSRGLPAITYGYDEGF